MPFRRIKVKKVVVITGGAGGIGQACVDEFVKENIVIILDVNQKAIDECIKKYNVFGYVVDLLDIDSISNVVKEIKERFERIDILVQTAGIMGSQNALEVTKQQWELMMKVNVEGMFFMMQEVVKQSMQVTGGVILNFSSEAAIRGFQGPMASVHYSASKGAVISMSRQLAVEWGQYNIRVNSISPGGVMTPAMSALDFQEDFQNIPLKRLSSPKEISQTVAYLCSDNANMITGQNIVVDGGCAAVGV